MKTSLTKKTHSMVTQDQLIRKETKEAKMPLKNLPEFKWSMLKIMISIAVATEKKTLILRHSSLKVLKFIYKEIGMEHKLRSI